MDDYDRIDKAFKLYRKAGFEQPVNLLESYGVMCRLRRNGLLWDTKEFHTEFVQFIREFLEEAKRRNWPPIIIDFGDEFTNTAIEEFGAKDPRSWSCAITAHTSGLSLTLLSALGTPVNMAYAPMAAPPLAASPLAFAPADLPPMPPFLMGGTLVVPNPVSPPNDELMYPLYFCSPAQEDVEAVRVQIFDRSGRLGYEHEEEGSRMEWQTENDEGEYLANGVYLYKLYMRVDGVWIATEVQKLVILR